MKLSHIFIYGDNLNSLCDFYSFVFDCEVILTDDDPYLIFDSYKFVFKKVFGKRDTILPSFQIELNDRELNDLNQRLSLFSYKSQKEFIRSEKNKGIVEYSDPCDNLFLVQPVMGKSVNQTLV